MTDTNITKWLTRADGIQTEVLPIRGRLTLKGTFIPDHTDPVTVATEKRVYVAKQYREILPDTATAAIQERLRYIEGRLEGYRREREFLETQQAAWQVQLEKTQLGDEH